MMSSEEWKNDDVMSLEQLPSRVYADIMKSEWKIYVTDRMTDRMTNSMTDVVKV